MIILFVRPCHDDVISYLYYYSDELVRLSNSKGFKTLNKEKEQANATVVGGIISVNKPEFIMFNGHGNERCICGHNDEIIIGMGKGCDLSLLNNKITYSLSCSSASKLGEKVGNDKTTFIGYTDDFALAMDTNCQASIKRDNIAKFFLEPSNLLVKSILKGNSVDEAVNKAKELMKSNISKLRTTNSFLNATDYIPYLFNNYMVLKAHGNVNARLNVS